MHVPLLDLQAQFAPIRDEVLAAVERVCDSQRFVMGPEVDAFEQEIGTLLRVKHAIGVEGTPPAACCRNIDVVVTSNAGFPLDQNLYQAVKGMSAAAQVVKYGGTIVCAAECRDGFPDHGSFRNELTQQPTPEKLPRQSGARTDRARPVAGAGSGEHPAARARHHAHVVPLRRASSRRAHLEQTGDVGAIRARGAGSRRRRRTRVRASRRAADDPVRRLSGTPMRLPTGAGASAPGARRTAPPGSRQRARGRR